MISNYKKNTDGRYQRNRREDWTAIQCDGVKGGTPSTMRAGRKEPRAQNTRGPDPLDNRGQSCQGSDEDSGALASGDLELFGCSNAPNVDFSGYAGDE